MLKYIFCLLFTLNSTFSYDMGHTFDAVSKSTRQQEFFADQNHSLQKAIKEHSIVYEVRQQLLHKGIQMLQLPKLNIQVGGNELSETNLNKLFEDQSTKFVNEIITDFDKIIANMLILINLRAQKKLPDGSVSEPKIISYFTTLDILLSCKNLADYCEQLAILNEWTYYSNFTIVVIPKGARLQAMVGLTAAQKSKEDKREKIVKEVGEKQALNYISKSGGASQIYIAHASEYYVYDMGGVSMMDFKKICIKNLVNENTHGYLPLLEFLNIKLKDSFRRIHDMTNTVYNSLYYTNPLSILFYETNVFQNFVKHSQQKLKNSTREIHKIPSIVKAHSNKKAIIPHKEPQRALRILRASAKKSPFISLPYAIIAPAVMRALKIIR